MSTEWIEALTVELRDGYTVTDASGEPARIVMDVRVRIDGGYLHITRAGAATAEIVSAPAVQKVVYRLK
jgi:hypothetical protein